ncbi:hypothetical protein Sjap_014902 [Stephania japonica]|uniref:Uncharacterized protein n=1 Tax=Stephania japonica TaxID=461633 RepID=A0AAP0IIL4_9MAGN
MSISVPHKVIKLKIREIIKRFMAIDIQLKYTIAIYIYPSLGLSDFHHFAKENVSTKNK